MEAFAALGIVCNLLQLTSYGVKIVAVSKEIYDHGLSNENEWILQNAEKMDNIVQQLDQNLASLNSTGNLTSKQQELSHIAKMCRDTCKQLQEEIAKLHLDPKGSGWRKALTKSVTTLRSRKTVKALEAKLQQQSELVQTSLLTDISLQHEACMLQNSERFSDMDNSLQQIVTSLAKGQSKLADHLAILNKDLVVLIRAEGIDVRQDLKSHMEAAQFIAEREQKREKFLASFRFQEINDRVNTIPKSHMATFEWIFKPVVGGIWDNFEEWLRSGSKIYWISGKPGSGKSVLMKFIVDHSKTQQILDQWAGEKPVFKISFFIWKGGTRLQREKRGLLCSLVLQLLNHCQDYFSKALTTFKAHMKLSAADWSVQELCDLLVELAKMHLAKVCLFIDGLDESEDTDGDFGMLDLVQRLADLDGWKVCAASRPEPDFQAVLAKYPKLHLQDLTHDDLKQYATDKLQEVSESGLFDEEYDLSVPDRLVALVCDKADGVFLWIRFAVSTVVRGVRRMDDWDDLLNRLNKLPSELEQLYVDMWKRSEKYGDEYDAEAAEYFRLVMTTQREPLSCFDLMVFKSKNAQSLLTGSDSCPSLSSLYRDCTRIERRIISCSRGFLECQHRVVLTPNSRSNVVQIRLTGDEIPTLLWEFRNTRISFVHRTAIDFLQDTTVGRQLLDYTDHQSDDLAKLRTNALIVAPYCEFPIVDLYALRKLFQNGHASTMEEKVVTAQQLEVVHDKIIHLNKLKSSQDIIRIWIDSVLDGKWRPTKFYEGFDPLEAATPFEYAIGWRSYIANAGIVSYYQNLLSTTAGIVSANYATCLAACAASNICVRPGDIQCEAQRIKLIKLLQDQRADLNTRHAINFGTTLSMDTLSLFCTHFRRSTVPNDADREHILKNLGLLLTEKINFSQTSIHALNLYVPNDGTYNGEIRMGIFPALPTTSSYPYSFFIIVQLNLTALLRFYMQSLSTPEERISSMLCNFEPAHCTLVALLKREDSPENKAWRPAAVDDDSCFFYSHFDKCASYGNLSTPIDLRGRKLEIEERIANAKFLSVIDEIRDRAVETDYQELMSSLGWWTTDQVVPGDIPFLQPFDEVEVDCSKFMFQP